MNVLNNNGILINLSTMVSGESLCEYIAEIQHKKFDLRFVYDSYRFIIEKHYTNDWTFVIEDAKVDMPDKPILYLEHIESLTFYSVLQQHLK